MINWDIVASIIVAMILYTLIVNILMFISGMVSE